MNIYEDKGNTQIWKYYDFNWVESSIGECSTTWYCVFIGGNIIS